MTAGISRWRARSRRTASARTRTKAYGWGSALVFTAAAVGCRPVAETTPAVTQDVAPLAEDGTRPAPEPAPPSPPAEEPAPAPEPARDTLRIALHAEPSKAHDSRARRAEGATEENRLLEVGAHLALLDREQLVVLRMEDVRERPDAIRLRAWSGRLALRAGDEGGTSHLEFAPAEVVQEEHERLTLGGLPFRWSLALAHESAWFYYPETGDALIGRLSPCPDDPSGASLCGLVRRGTGDRARWLSGAAERDALPWSIELTDEVLAHWRASLDVARQSSWRRTPGNKIVCRGGDKVLVFREGVLGLFRLVLSETDRHEAELQWQILSSDGTITLDSGRKTATSSSAGDGIVFGPFVLPWFPRREGRYVLNYAAGCGTWIAPVPEERAVDLDIPAEMQRARLFEE